MARVIAFPNRGKLLPEPHRPQGEPFDSRMFNLHRDVEGAAAGLEAYFGDTATARKWLVDVLQELEVKR